PGGDAMVERQAADIAAGARDLGRLAAWLVAYDHAQRLIGAGGRQPRFEIIEEAIAGGVRLDAGCRRPGEQAFALQPRERRRARSPPKSRADQRLLEVASGTWLNENEPVSRLHRLARHGFVRATV